MTIAFIIGRIIVGVYFLINAYNHIIKGSGMVPYAASKGVPSPRAAIFCSGLLLLVGGLSIILGVEVAFGITALLLFMIPVTFVMHNYWKETDPMMRMNQQISFMKNFAIVGLLLMAYAIATPWVWSLV